MQRGWVKDPDATEPTSRGYAMARVTGLLFVVVAIWILIRQI